MPRLDMLTDRVADTQPSEFANSIPLADTAGRLKRRGRRPAKRNRQWEKTHRPYRYVNVPLELREQVLALAGYLLVPADEVARAFLEYALECVDEEKLQLQPRPNPLGRKMTLFPGDRTKGWRLIVGTPQEMPSRRNKKSEQNGKPHSAASYRLPDGLHNELCGLAMELAVPVGELVSFLLQHGLDAYQRGNLSLKPHPQITKMTLFGNGS
jgi:hypothetical protein